MTTRIRADHVLGFDEATGDHRLLGRAEVVVDGSLITAVGPVGSEATGDEVVDLGNALLLPGLIDLDAVADIDHALLDSWSSAEHSRGFSWSADYAESGPRAVFTAEERRTIRRFALAQLLCHGITTCLPIASEVHSDWAESFDDLVALAEEAEVLGIRLVAGPSYRSGVGVVDSQGRRSVNWRPDRGRSGFDGALRFLNWVDARQSGLISGALVPCRIETLDDALLRDTAQAGRDLGVVVRLHALQGLEERDRLAERSSETPLQMMDRLDVLGPNLLIPHAIYLDGRPDVDARDRANGVVPIGEPEVGLRLLAENGVSIVHCPLTSLRYGVALESFARFRDAGIRIALGTDSFPPDLVRGIDVGHNVAKLVDGRLDAAGIDDYLRAATLRGADALGRSDLGRVAAGAQADLVAFGFDDFRDGVLDDPVRTLVMNGTARGARFSMVAGRTVMRDGALPGVDLAALREEAQRLFARLRTAYSGRDAWHRTPEELFPATFP
ncbi:ethylammeline chlorohydrolase [Frondihabitans sucicola]|uniref:Ethylammeline chlorohydrolase n=1 Tax=Frondihabitans sucicola TaxID=1268041 RepID=A0ABM8GS74_9MICO|nr:chlorohydrolase family protein [Frondihabitans sucicola]BDZ51331.1 ethylammeline chlorohydrolase [Frondihabitans sucicola]